MGYDLFDFADGGVSGSLGVTTEAQSVSDGASGEVNDGARDLGRQLDHQRYTGLDHLVDFSDGVENGF